MAMEFCNIKTYYCIYNGWLTNGPNDASNPRFWNLFFATFHVPIINTKATRDDRNVNSMKKKDTFSFRVVRLQDTGMNEINESKAKIAARLRQRQS